MEPRFFGLTPKKTRVASSDESSGERISVILPVLNEAGRIEHCLVGLSAQPEEVREILVVDGGSTDATQAVVARFQEREPRLRWIDASPVDPRWTGKAWGLNFGLEQSDPACRWLLCVDADVRLSPRLARSLLAHAKKTGMCAFSLATQQVLSGPVDALIHPAMLTTLVYRFGSPGRATSNPHKVQANGQCFMARRETLLRTGAFRAARASLCEDITMVRRIAECGEAVGFYESENLASVAMYDHWRETWANWPRSLPMRDQFFGWREAVGLIVVLFLQALPLPLFLLGAVLGAPLWSLAISGFFVAMRAGVLIGTARAYPAKPWTYWLSPLSDVPVALRVIHCALRRRHNWRGRTYVRRKGGVFEPLA